MRQFIQYLYEYGQGRRLRNVGFVKAELDEGGSVIHIHGKGLRLQGETSLQLYLFYEDEGRYVGILQGEIQNINPAVNYRLSYTKDDVGVPENYGRICGVLLISQTGQRYVATWNGMDVPIEQMQVWQAPQEDASVELEETVEAAQEVIDEEPGEVTETLNLDVQEDVSVTKEEEFDPEEMLCIEAVEPDEDSGEGEWKITKIQRNEISMLPRCEWRLANNNFLLHGYYNYRHLVLIDNGDILKLGVPGIYHEKEARAAAAFGFPEFVGEEDTNLNLEPEECNPGQQFGYWCRQVRRPVM